MDYIIELKLRLAQKQSTIDELSSNYNWVLLENECLKKRSNDSNLKHNKPVSLQSNVERIMQKRHHSWAITNSLNRKDIFCTNNDRRISQVLSEWGETDDEDSLDEDSQARSR